MGAKKAGKDSTDSGNSSARRTIRPKNKTTAAVHWYQRKRPFYEQLCQKVEAIVREVLDSECVQCHSITSRAKTVDSFAAKAGKEGYVQPEKQIKDMAGIRLIAYVDSEARRIAELVESLFDIDPEHSGDTSVRLGVDKLGYRATHYVARFSKDRCRLPEYKRFEGLEFEIQVRTILQHAWAEIEHDRNYKFAGVLPDDIQRRFAILSGVLEMADREFDAIASSIDSYAASVAEKTEKGDLDIPINTTSLREYMLTKFRDVVEAGLDPSFESEESVIMRELNEFGISTLAELDSVVPPELLKQVDHIDNYNLVGLARDIMVIHDANRYFRKAWKRRWTGLGQDTLQRLSFHGIDLPALAERYGFDVVH